ncbi:pyruvate dehydrogenase (acetyl-transferring) E1 component subunit alpha [Burkholderia sp. MS389]|nr:pyruvate dehydrogenase (acetyl-transferring) E1 component subunit alpha [Burkholderia sp. AU31280]QRR17638.1 pyruvate dehydrogenase (acetyl-transferring) E1 component subunit alpha [Burkholderia sp. MS389]RQR75389.1 thiamine pyrophosphate-dependent dehydrogenase E1 component subunit alpha [Burkholderia sp. Bp9015]RQS24764.1 thiamine pyrophosphate-dependent dehydrogenase E1 component subunit alpha [Burkholderia sp. Bp8998]RQU29726.1 thiamine pyrophosphate-dependent dehydrogenase E1 component 
MMGFVAEKIEGMPEVYRHVSAQALRDALKKMQLVRRFEESAEQAYMRGLIHGTMHLSIGQEASAIAMTMLLTDEDYITSTHRGHGHCIGKGADPKRMFAEFFGKETGYCRGRGGSMHIADVSRGNLGANGIVGGGLPIAVGAALSIKKRRKDSVVVCFFGDGANNEGAFHESLNFAAIWKLPVIFVCENNRYGMSMSVERSTAVSRISQRAAAYDMPGVTVDGNSFGDVLTAAEGAIERARKGEGPTLIECETYRIRGHSKSDRNRYRTREEIESWGARDPIAKFERQLVELGLIDAAAVQAIHAEVEEEIKAGLDYAQNSPAPDIAELTRYVYTENGGNDHE